MRKWFTNRQTSNGAKKFQSPSVIMCHHSIGVVTYVRRRVLLKVKRVKCTKNDPTNTASFRQVSRVRGTTPRVVGPVTNHSPTSGSSLVTFAMQSNHSPTSEKLVSHLSEARATTGQSY
jgi:hypothetical protein